MTLLTITCAAIYSWFADGSWEGALFPGELAVFQQWHFLCGQHQGCHPPFEVFPKGKDGADLCQELVSPPSSRLDTIVALAEAAKGTTRAHSLDVSRWLPDSGSYNARRMAESFMPAEHNAS